MIVEGTKFANKTLWVPIIINNHFHRVYMSQRHVVIIMSLQWGLFESTAT